MVSGMQQLFSVLAARVADWREAGRAYIIEVKAERERDHPVDGEKGRKAMALKRGP